MLDVRWRRLMFSHFLKGGLYDPHCCGGCGLWCSARRPRAWLRGQGEVAKDRLKEKIDSLLGSMDVKRKEIEIGVNGLKEGINGLRKAKIKAQVCADQIQRQAMPQEEKLASMDTALKTLRVHLEAAKPVEIAGKTYSPQELKDLASRVLTARKAAASKSDRIP